MINMKKLDTHDFYHIVEGEQVNSVMTRGLEPKFDHQLHVEERHSLLRAVNLFHPNNVDVLADFLDEYEKSDLAVIEVAILSLPPRGFIADEDYFQEYADEETRENAYYWSNKLDRKAPSKESFRGHVHDSLEEAGSLAYKGVIPPDCINLFDVDEYLKTLSDEQRRDIEREVL